MLWKINKHSSQVTRRSVHEVLMYVSEQFIVCLEIFNNKQAAECRSHFSLATIVYSIILFIPLIIIIVELRTKNGLKEEAKEKKGQSPVMLGTGGSIFGLRYFLLLIRCC